MGRRIQKERERKRAASSCHSIEMFMPSRKKPEEESTSSRIQSADDLDSTSDQTELQDRDQTVCSEPLSEDHNENVDDDTLSEFATNLYSQSVSETADPSCSLSEARSELTELAVVAAIEESEVHKTITDNGEETLILFHTTQVVEDTATTDIGNILKPNPLPDQFCQAMKSLSAPAKYDVLKNPQVHAPHKKFPTQYLGGCNRSFKPVWLSQHSWMVYCDKVDGVFCAPCALFSCQPSRGNFVCKPFRTWHKKSEKTKEHEKCLYHQQALKQAEDLKRSIEHPGSTINCL